MRPRWRRRGKAMAIYQPKYTDKKTGEIKVADVWWFDFIFAGKRYRESTGTSRKTLAANCEQRRRRELERYRSEGVRPESHTAMLQTVNEAVDLYQAQYDAPHHRDKSIAWVKERLPHVKRLLGSLA